MACSTALTASSSADDASLPPAAARRLIRPTATADSPISYTRIAIASTTA